MRIGQLEWLAAGPAIARAAQQRLEAGEAQQPFTNRSLQELQLMMCRCRGAQRRPLALEIFRRAGQPAGIRHRESWSAS